MKAGARVGDQAFCPVDAHRCKRCPHKTVGPAVVGSTNVLINGLGALRLGDKGMQAACCGPNQWVVALGSPVVWINNRPAARMGDMTVHCGGVGKLMTGSANVLIGDSSGSAEATTESGPGWIKIVLQDEQDQPVPWEPYSLKLPNGKIVEGFLDRVGEARLDGIPEGNCQVCFPNRDGTHWQKA